LAVRQVRTDLESITTAGAEDVSMSVRAAAASRYVACSSCWPAGCVRQDDCGNHPRCRGHL